MRNSLIGTLASIALFTGATAPAQAATIVNGTFESGDLTGWYSRGYQDQTPVGSTTAVLPAGSGYPPLAGAYSALIVAVSTHGIDAGFPCWRDVWNFNCPLPAPFSPSVAPAPTYYSINIHYRFYRGGFIAQDVNVAAGDTLQWVHQLMGELASNGDNAWFIATDGVTESVVNLRSGTQSFTFSHAGLYSIYFGVQQTEDPTIWSALKVDSVSFVPAAAKR